MTTPLSYTTEDLTETRLGLIVLQSDETIEGDFRRLLPDRDVALMVSRVASGAEVSSDSLAEMAERLTQSASLFPDGVEFAAMGYGCTSASAEIGADRVAELICAGAKTPHVTNPLSALIAACHANGVRRLAFLSPYVEQVSAKLRDALNAAGIETPVFGSFDEPSEAAVVRITPDSLIHATDTLVGGADVDAVFLSCTNLRTLDVLDVLERRLGLPVWSSNLVLAWHMMTLADGDGTPITPSALQP